MALAVDPFDPDTLFLSSGERILCTSLHGPLATSPVLATHPNAVWSLSFSSETGRLFSVSADDRVVRAWSPCRPKAPGDQKKMPLLWGGAPIGAGRITDITASDGLVLCSGDYGVLALDQRTGVVVWEVANGQSVAAGRGVVVVADWESLTVKAFEGAGALGAPVWTCWTVMRAFVVCVSADGADVAVGGVDGSLSLFELRTGCDRWGGAGRRRIHRMAVASIAVEGEFIVTASFDCLATVLLRHDGSVLCSLRGHKDWVLSALFVRQQRVVITASHEGAVRVWPWMAMQTRALTSLTGCLEISQDHQEVLAQELTPRIRREMLLPI
jgi:WD40 repeat protein